jgi:hypothetical protein
MLDLLLWPVDLLALFFRASFVEVRVGDGCSWNINAVAKDDWGLNIGFRKGGRGLLLYLLVGTERTVGMVGAELLLLLGLGMLGNL